MSKDEALRLALEALKTIDEAMPFPVAKLAQSAIKQALAQSEQEPVGKFAKFTDGVWREVTDGSPGVLLYTAPPQRELVGLTDEDLKLLSAEWRIVYGAWMDDFAKDIETKLKEKNFTDGLPGVLLYTAPPQLKEEDDDGRC